VLEEKVAERTETLSESNRVKEKMIAIILHDLRSPLRFLHLLATHIHDNHQRVTAPELEDMLGKFQHATHDLYTFTQDFVVWTNAQKEGFVIQAERLNLRAVAGEIVSLYEAGADLRNNTILNLAPEAIDLVTDPHILKLLIRNLIDNSNKYTLNGEIRIEAWEEATAVGITIADSGRSMDAELVDNILNNRYRSGNDSHGFGYTLILELLTRIDGRLQIETPAAGGNRITLRLPK
jgi:K+-sensing histidine kinase KdpD